jgi:predicted HAD superfamily hydrolase
MSVARTRAMRAMLEDHDGVVSFDVFDTLLWRRHPRPIDVFHDIPGAAARRGRPLPRVDAAAFATARRGAEAMARLLVAEELETREVTLHQIHHRLALALVWDMGDEELMTDLRAAELAAERETLVADRELLRLTDELASAERRMVIVSDSYLSAPQVAALVTAAGYPAATFERSFTSSNFGVSKSSGLFDVVIKELDLHPAQLLHVGDLPAPISGRWRRWMGVPSDGRSPGTRPSR